MLGPVIGPSSGTLGQRLLFFVVAALPLLVFFPRWLARLACAKLRTSLSATTWAIRALAVGVHLASVAAAAASRLPRMWQVAALFYMVAFGCFCAYRLALGMLSEDDGDL